MWASNNSSSPFLSIRHSKYFLSYFGFQHAMHFEEFKKYYKETKIYARPQAPLCSIISKMREQKKGRRKSQLALNHEFYHLKKGTKRS